VKIRKIEKVRFNLSISNPSNSRYNVPKRRCHMEEGRSKIRASKVRNTQGQVLRGQFCGRFPPASSTKPLEAANPASAYIKPSEHLIRPISG